MKKIAVLLMFVAFASFITGCSLTGKSRDAAGLEALTGSMVPFTVSSVIDGTLAGNLRGSVTYTMEEVKAMTIEIDGKTLVFDKIISTSPLEVSFKANIPAVELLKIVEKSATKPIEMVVKAAGKEIKKFEITNLPEEIATTEKATPKLTISLEGDVKITATGKKEDEKVVVVTELPTETNPDIPAVVELTPSIAVKSSYGGEVIISGFKTNDTITSANPAFIITLKNGANVLDLTNMDATFKFNVVNETTKAKMEVSQQVKAVNPVYDHDLEGDKPFMSGLGQDLTQGQIFVETMRALTNGAYTVNITSMVFKSGKNQYRLQNLTYKFTINAQE